MNSGTSDFKFVNRPTFPVLIDIELTNTCNFRCRMCETGLGTSARPKGLMSEAVFHKILREASSVRPQPALRFIRWGEPTLHPYFLGWLVEAKSMGFPVHFNTNGYTLSENMMRTIVKNEIDSIKFSFQGADAASYAEMRGIDFFEALFGKISSLTAIRGERMVPFIQVSTTLTDETPEQIEYFKMKASLADFYNIGKTDMRRVKIERLKIQEADQVKFLLERENPDSRIKPKSCSEVFAKLSIDWDGSVTACCGDNNRELKIGDLNSESLSEIFHSEAMLRLQTALSQNDFGVSALCLNCVETYPAFDRRASSSGASTMSA